MTERCNYEVSDAGRVRNMSTFYPRLHRDYESRSCADLKKVGAHIYAQDPTTRILVAVWIIEYEEGKYSDPIIWHGDKLYYDDIPMPEEIAKLIEDGVTVCGHNAAFEDAIDRYHAGLIIHNWKIPKPAQLNCTMSRAAAQALPLDLDRLGAALDLLIKKDTTGHRLMLTMCKPRKPDKSEDPDGGPYWVDDWGGRKLERLTAYCIADVRAEIAVDRVLRQLQDHEHEIWLHDQVMNNRGVEVDLDFVRTAKAVVERAMKRVNKRLRLVTGGAVERVTQVERIKEFARWHGVEFKETAKRNVRGEMVLTEAADREALQDLLDIEDTNEEHEGGEDGYDLKTLPGKPNEIWQEGDRPSVRAAIELRLEAGKSSLRKLDKFLWQAPQGRSRGNLQYHAAGPGRWGGRGIQLQNMVRAGISEPGGWDAAYRDMKELGDEEFEMVWGSPFDVVSRMMRGAVVAAPGHKLYFADYAQVEARGCVWAAAQMDMVRMFAEGGLIYEEMASRIFGLSVEEVLHRHKTKSDILPRFVGKETILGCGYGMGWAAFKRNCKKKGRLILDDDLCQKGVNTWRESNPKVVQLWYQLGDAMRNAIEDKGAVFKAGPFAFRKIGKWLQMRLPSGRLLWYRRPHFRPADADLETYDAGQGVPRDKWRITFYGVNSVTKQWSRETTWGGKILENGVQGMCRDFLADAQLRLEAAGYPIVLSVHDEAIAETPIGFGSVKEFVQIMTELPGWGVGFPLRAEGSEGFRYAKG